MNRSYNTGNREPETRLTDHATAEAAGILSTDIHDNSEEYEKVAIERHRAY